MFPRERSQSAAQLVAGELVSLGGDDEEIALHCTQEMDELPVRLLRRDVGIYEHDGESQGIPVLQVGLNELGPLSRDFARNLGVTVAGQVYQQQFRVRLCGLGVNSDEVDRTRAAGRGTDMRQLLVKQGIDQAGFADVRTSQEREFGWAFRREELGIGGGGKEFGDRLLHWLSTSVAS